MASTPPLQINAEARTPPTPLHGSVYHGDSPSTRYNTRASAKRFREMSHQSPDWASDTGRAGKTPRSPRFSSQTSLQTLHSPQSTPKQRTNRRVHVMAPPSPDQDSPAPQPAPPQKSSFSSYLSSTTTLSDGMLPTPVKTPKKKSVQTSSATGRVLFQEQSQTHNMAPSPRKVRKTKRYNGFSLESFSADDSATQSNIQIFTDSRDQVPEVDATGDNPFLDLSDAKVTSSAQKLPGTVKRRKTSSGKKLDAQVQEAIDQDEGMVYVFRGKKVYRRFDDQGEDEEDIDVDDLGLLQHNAEGTTSTGPFKTLTRKSIRPTRLFESQAQRNAREIENEEEADTEIEEEDPTLPSSASNAKVRKAVDKNEVEHGTGPDPVNGAASSTASTRANKNSPFDSWRRIKPGSQPITSPRSKTRKRTATDALEDSPEQPSTKLNRTN